MPKVKKVTRKVVEYFVECDKCENVDRLDHVPDGPHLCLRCSVIDLHNVSFESLKPFLGSKIVGFHLSGTYPVQLQGLLIECDGEEYDAYVRNWSDGPEILFEAKRFIESRYAREPKRFPKEKG